MEKSDGRCSEAAAIKDSPNSSDSLRELRATEGGGGKGERRASGLERRREGSRQTATSEAGGERSTAWRPSAELLGMHCLLRSWTYVL